MRWFKHMTHAFDDEKIARLMDECGLEGYGFFWRVLETIAAQMDDSPKNYCSYPKRVWCKKLAINHQTWSKLISSCERVGLFIVSEDEQDIRVESPNILKFRDEWTKKKSKTPESLRSNSGLRARAPDTDTDTEEDKKEECMFEIACADSEPPLFSPPAHGNKNAKGTVPESPPVQNVDPEALEFAREFQNAVTAEHGNLAPRVTEAMLRKGALELERVSRIEGIDGEEAKDALMWAVTDRFWGQNVRSLGNIRSRMKNGALKIQGVVADFRKSGHSPQSEEQPWWANAL